MFPAQLWQGGVCVADCYPLGYFELLPIVLALAMAIFTRRWRYVPVAAAISLALFFGFELAWRALVLSERPFAYLRVFASQPEQWLLAYASTYVEMVVVVVLAFAIKRALAWIFLGQAPLVQRTFAFFALLAVLGLGMFAHLFISAPDQLPRRWAERAHEFAGDAPSRCKLGDAAPVAGLPAFKSYRPPERPPSVVVGMPEAYASFPAVYTTWMSFEHMLTRVAVIHVPDVKRYEPLTAIAVEVAVSETGQVLAVKPTAGPRNLYPQAIDIASRWKFLPFTRDGKAVPVRLVRAFVPIGGPELWGPHVDMPRVSDWDDIDIKLERGEYESRFTLEIRGDGSVTYDGEGVGLALRGRHCAVVPHETIVALVEEIRRADVYSMQPVYDAETPTDLTIALDDSVKRVRVGQSMLWEAKLQAPEKLWPLIDAVLEAVHVERWTVGDRFTAPSLVAERWNFKRRDNDNFLMLAGVASGGNVQAVRDLVALGAPAMVAPRKAPPFGPTRMGHTALELAAERGRFDVVRVLLDAHILWSADALGGAYVGALAQGDRKIADELLARGANPSAKGSDNEMTALMAAAASGLPDEVGAALQQGADVNAQDRSEIAALHYAAGADYLKTIDFVRADRRRVIDMLVKAGAKIETKANIGSTPLIANWMGLEDVTDALIRHGAGVNAVADYEGETALMTNKSVGAVRLLLAAGADPYLRNNRGQNAIDVARADVFAQDIVPILERWMATHPAAPSAKPAAAAPGAG